MMLLQRHILTVEQNDLKYWESLIQGDEEAFTRLYEKYFKILYNYGCKICIDRGAVKDAINDLFIDLWRYKSNLSPSISIRFYLYSSLRRRLINTTTSLLFTSHDDFAVAETLQLASPSKENEMIESETRNQQVQQLKRLLNDLSPRQHEAMVLFYYDEFSYEEIADIMHVNAQSVRNLVQRGLVHLRQHVKYIVSLLIIILEY